MTNSQHKVAPPAGKAMLFQMAERWRPARHLTKLAHTKEASKAKVNAAEEK
jgi:hypothetical protein